MVWDVNIAAGLVAGVAAMVPGAVIYTPSVLGNRWMKEIGSSPEKMKAAGGDPNKAVGMMLLASLINGLVASALIGLTDAATVGDAVAITMALAWFWVSSSLMLVFFEMRSWAWFQISALSHILTAAVIGVVLGLFL